MGTKKITDADLNKRFGVPLRTLSDWKNSSNYRVKVYQALRMLISMENDLLETEGRKNKGVLALNPEVMQSKQVLLTLADIELDITLTKKSIDKQK